eukprot:7862439-Pyramimonas_sp.AAC.1
MLDLVENAASMGREPRDLMIDRLGRRHARVDTGDLWGLGRLYWISGELLAPWQGAASVVDDVEPVVVLGGPGPASPVAGS